MTVLMVGMRFALDTPILPEVMADWATSVTPATVFDFILTWLQVSAKPLLFVGLLLGQLLGGGALGLLYTRYSSALPFEESQPWTRGLALAAVLWLVVAALLTPIIGGGVFGTVVAGGAASYLIANLAGMAAYGVTLAHLHHMALTRGDDSYSEGRRELLHRAVFVGLAVVAGGFSLRAIMRGAGALSPARVFSRPGEMPHEVTPNDEFYEISKNIINPSVHVSGWTLQIDGVPDGPYSFTYDELLELPWVEEYVTLTCISNLVGGDLISNALWRGVPLKVLLERAGMPVSAERLAFHAADGYVDSFPMSYAMRENVIVAYLMNGEPLSDSHGFPARIVVPGLYGMENVKWLTRIEPVAADFRGFWQRRGWADTAVINTMSRIDVPAANAGVAPVEMEVGGVAFAGDRGIDFVEFSTDGGETWRRAESSDPLSPYAWVLWRATWTPPETGRVSITVRATDGAGTTQTADIRGNLPDGATGYHRISVVST